VGELRLRKLSLEKCDGQHMGSLFRSLYRVPKLVLSWTGLKMPYIRLWQVKSRIVGVVRMSKIVREILVPCLLTVCGVLSSAALAQVPTPGGNAAAPVPGGAAPLPGPSASQVLTGGGNASYRRLPINHQTAAIRLEELRNIMVTAKPKEFQDAIADYLDWLSDMADGHWKIYQAFSKVDGMKAQADVEKSTTLKLGSLKRQALLLKAEFLIRNNRQPEALQPLIDIVVAEPKTATGDAAYALLKQIGFSEEVSSHPAATGPSGAAGSSNKDISAVPAVPALPTASAAAAVAPIAAAKAAPAAVAPTTAVKAAPAAAFAPTAAATGVSSTSASVMPATAPRTISPATVKPAPERRVAGSSFIIN